MQRHHHASTASTRGDLAGRSAAGLRAAALDHQTPILHHGDPRLRERRGERVVPDPLLQPDDRGPRGEQIVEVPRKV